ncbi:MAG: hypothetical protein DMF55_13265 [Acidobacteria bacterium]|nr:MAG: hypothetical protein DMF55_13265 [Acidobacteriota bacterium]
MRHVRAVGRGRGGREPRLIDDPRRRPDPPEEGDATLRCGRIRFGRGRQRKEDHLGVRADQVLPNLALVSGEESHRDDECRHAQTDSGDREERDRGHQAGRPRPEI